MIPELFALTTALGLGAFVGWIVGNGRGWKACDAMWQAEWDSRQGGIVGHSATRELPQLPRRDPGATIGVEHGQPGAIAPPPTETVELVLDGLRGMDLPTQWGTLAEHGRYTERLPKLRPETYHDADPWTGAQFIPAECLTPTERVVRTCSTSIVSHRAIEPSVWARLVDRVRAWPLEPAEKFADWWRHAQHRSTHRLTEAAGALAQQARWNAPTGAYPYVQSAAWNVADADVAAFIDGELASVT